MADSNWIKLNRKIWDNFVWNFEKPQYALAWIDMLLLANYKDKQVMFGGKVETIQRGSFVTSMVKLAERWDMNRKTVKSFLDTLQADGMITYTTTKRRTTVFITNYLLYQGFAGSDGDSDGQLNGQLTGQPTGQLSGQPTGHNIRRLKKVKESKEGEEDSLILSNESICSTDVQRIIDAWNKLGLGQIKKIVTGTQRYDLLKKRIKDYGADTVVAAIERIRKSDFLMGNGDKGWVITFDWFIKPNNFPKVLDGNYDNNNKPSGGGREPKRNTGHEREAMARMEKYRQELHSKKMTGNDEELRKRAEELKKKLAKGDGNG